MKGRLIEIHDDYLVDERRSSIDVACTIVHEGQHARLFRLGFGYEESIRGRLERICHRAERKFARTIPGGDEYVARASAWMEADPDVYYSDAARRATDLEVLRNLGVPKPLVRIIDRITRRRAT